MQNIKPTAAIIPCYNEERTIAEVVRGCLQHVGKVIVVDDGSVDGTAAAAESTGAMVIQHEMNRGKGAAFRSGFEAANNYKDIVLLDGDGQHNPEEIPRLLDGLKGADMVIGNRMGSTRPMSWLRRFVNKWMSRRISNFVKFECPDSQCGFRAARVEALGKMTLREDRFQTESEMLVAAARAGLRVKFVPVSCRAAARPSRIAPLHDTVRWFIWWFLVKNR